MQPMPGPEGDHELMTVREAAKYLRCSRATVFRFLQNEQLPRFKVGGRTVLYAADVKALVRRTVQTTAVGAPGGNSQAHLTATAED